MLVTRGELAKALNLTKGRISQLEKAKVLRPTRGGKYNLNQAQELYLAHLASRGVRQPESTNAGNVQEIAGIQLERQQTRLAYEQLLMELTRLKMEIQRGVYVHLEKAKHTLAFLIFPLRANIESIVAKFAMLFAQNHQQAVEIHQALSDNIRWRLFGQLNTRDLEVEKTKLMTGADAVLSDAASTEAARRLAADVKAVYELIDPSIADKLGVKTFAIAGNLESPENPADTRIVDSAVVIARDHEQSSSPLVIASRSEDRITLHADQETILQLLFALIGCSGSTTFRTPVVMSARLTDIKFETKIGDAKPVPKYATHRKAEGE